MNRRTLKTEKLLPSSPSRKSAPNVWQGATKTTLWKSRRIILQIPAFSAWWFAEILETPAFSAWWTWKFRHCQTGGPHKPYNSSEFQHLQPGNHKTLEIPASSALTIHKKPSSIFRLVVANPTNSSVFSQLKFLKVLAFLSLVVHNPPRKLMHIGLETVHIFVF